MKKSLLITTILVAGVFCSLTLFAQVPRVVLQHAGQTSFFSSISAAITAAVDNDTIYIPGFNFNESISVDKKLVIYGTGHYPDSTIASGRSIIGSITFYGGGSGSIVQGLYLNSSIAFYGLITNITVSRCYITSISFQSTTAGSSQVKITECVVPGPIFGSPEINNVLVEKSVVGYFGYFTNSAIVKNCIILATHWYGESFIGCSNVYITSNVILQGADVQPTCLYKNNLYCANVAFTGLNTGNIVNQPISSIFTYLDPGSQYAFSYLNNYHLKAGCPGINAGEDGTDTGIYGTALPYREAAMPFNPHISTANISSQATTGGLLNVQIKVTAQDR